jgi:hypothetical protein
MSVRPPRDAAVGRSAAPAPERRSRLERVLAAGQQAGAVATTGAQAEDDPPDTDRDLSLITLSRGARTFEERNQPFAYCMDDDDVWGMCPPSQSPDTKNIDFYNSAFNSADSSKVSENVRGIAQVIEAGLVLGSYKDAMLRTLPARHPIATIEWWHKFLRTVPYDGDNPDEGSFNTVMKVSTVKALGQEMGAWFWAMTQGMFSGTNVPYDMNSSGRIVVRRNTLPDVNEYENILEAREKALAPRSVAREIYLTAYASYYKIGPTLIATYYLRDDIPTPPLPTPLTELVKATTKETKDTLSQKVLKGEKVAMDLPSVAKRPVARYVTVAMAWQGDAHKLLVEWSRPQFDGVRDRLYAVFAYRLVDLFVNASVVGLFHGDLNAKNVLCRVKADPKTGETLPTTLKLCMTDFDPQFVVLVPPKERRTCAHCLVVASLCSFLGFVRCFQTQKVYASGTWEALKNYVRPILKDVLMGKDVGALEEGRKDPLCAFLNDTTTIHREAFGKPGGRRADLGEGYEGQKRIISSRWQHMVMHYMNGMRAVNRKGPGGNDRFCIPLDKDKPFYNQVVAYAFGDDLPKAKPAPAPAGDPNVKTPPPAPVKPDVETPAKKRAGEEEAAAAKGVPKDAPKTKSFSEVDGVAR